MEVGLRGWVFVVIPETLAEAEVALNEELDRLNQILVGAKQDSSMLVALIAFLAELIPAIDNLEEELE